MLIFILPFTAPLSMLCQGIGFHHDSEGRMPKKFLHDAWMAVVSE